MKILYLNNSDVYNMDVIEVLENRGHNIITISIPDEDYELSKQMIEQEKNVQSDSEFMELRLGKKEEAEWIKKEKKHEILQIMAERGMDIVFSLGFYPCISELSAYYGILYVSWVVEPPYSSLFFRNVILKNNMVFLADKQMTAELQEEGIENVYYLPKGVNINRCNRIINDGKIEKNCWNLSLVGTVKNKSWEEYFGADSLKSSTKGYLDGIVACQRHVYGLDFFSKLLPKYVLDDLMENGTIAPALGSVETLEHYYREQCFYPKMTVIDRLVMLDALSRIEEIHLYSDDDRFEKERIINCGNLENINSLELIKKTKINLNLTPRGYRDGLYGNALEIMGMGGFLISDYRPELEKEFLLGEELLIYEDVADLLNKILYYKEQEEERNKIAKKGQEKVRKLHSLNQRLEMIEQKIEKFREDNFEYGK